MPDAYAPPADGTMPTPISPGFGWRFWLLAGVAVLGCLSTVFVYAFWLPHVEQMWAESNAKLPSITVFALSVSKFIQQWTLVGMAFGLVAGVIAVGPLRFRPQIAWTMVLGLLPIVIVLLAIVPFAIFAPMIGQIKQLN